MDLYHTAHLTHLMYAHYFFPPIYVRSFIYTFFFANKQLYHVVLITFEFTLYICPAIGRNVKLSANPAVF